MVRAFRHALALIIAVSLVAGTAAWRPCMAMQIAAAAAEHLAVSSPHMDAHHHDGHDHLAMHHEPSSDAPAAPASDDHGCLKCCAMCTVATVLPSGVADATVLTVTAAVFFGGPQHWSGATVPIDPGIPKRIV